MPAYTTYKALAEAFKDGTLDRNKLCLKLGNDVSFLVRIDLESDDPHYNWLQDEAAELFTGHACHYEDVLDILEAAGIPAESV